MKDDTDREMDCQEDPVDPIHPIRPIERRKEEEK